MKINNRLIQYTAGIIFLLAYLLIWFTPSPKQSDIPEQPSEFKVSATTINGRITIGCQIRKLSLEITLFNNPY